VGKTPKSTSQSYSGSSNPAFQPIALGAAGNVQSVFNQAQPGLQQLTNTNNQTVVPGLTGQFQTGLAGANQASGYNSDVVSGKYMNGNPYIQSILSQLNSQIRDNVGSQFEGAGRYGSGAFADLLSKNIGNADANVLYGNYSDEMARRDAAAGALQQGSLGDTAGLLQALQQGSTMPYAGSESLANSLGALFSGGQDKSKQTGTNPIWGALGAGLGAAGSIFAGKSDRRLKSNIVKVGELEDGLGVYEYDLDGTRQRGVMADEVEKLRPWAFIPNFWNGFDGVAYGLLNVGL